MKKLIALYKCHRGAEWLDASLDSIAGRVDGVVAVLSEKSWDDNGLPGNCFDELMAWKEDNPDWIHVAKFESPKQEEQYQYGLQLIREIHGDDVAVLVIDSDEVWQPGDLARLREAIDANPDAHYFTAKIYSYVRSPLYQVWPVEQAMHTVALQSPKEQEIGGRFRLRKAGKTFACKDVYFHHFTYVREDEAEIAVKLKTTESQDKAGSSASWMDTVWPRLPLGCDLHMAKGWESAWREIKVLDCSPMPLPEWVADIAKLEAARWRETIRTLPVDQYVPSPTEHDWRMYYGDFAKIPLSQGGELLRKRLKMTYLEALLLWRSASWVPEDSRMLEIGSASGASAALLAAGSKATIWAIDPFEPYDEMGINLVKGWKEGSLEEFWETARHYDFVSRVRQFKCRSDEAAPQCPDGGFGLIFVDGNHSEKVLRADLDDYWPKVAPGGVLIGHDYCARFPGAIRAVDGWEKEAGVELEFFPGTSLFWARKKQ